MFSRTDYGRLYYEKRLHFFKGGNNGKKIKQRRALFVGVDSEPY